MDGKKESRKKESIVVENLSKRFRMTGKSADSILGRSLSFFFGMGITREFYALNDISFKVRIGEKIGIIGRNGSGKSTLLRVIAGIYTADSGYAKTRGKVTYLEGFGRGLKQKLTMTENIYLIGSILGLSPRGISSIFDGVIEFSGLGDYVNTKVYQFSDGMISRLAFSITINCIAYKNPDIILMDDIFAGGADIDFKIKSLRRMKELIKPDTTLLIASHNLNLIRNYCNKVIRLDKGKIIKYGSPEGIINQYINTNKPINVILNKSKSAKKRQIPSLYKDD